MLPRSSACQPSLARPPSPSAWASRAAAFTGCCPRLVNAPRALLRAEINEALRDRGVSLVLLAPDGDVSGNGSKLFLIITAAFAEVERGRIRERIGHQKERGRFLGGILPWGYRKGKDGALEPAPEYQAAIARMRRLRAEGVSLRKIMGQMSVEGHAVMLPILMRG